MPEAATNRRSDEQAQPHQTLAEDNVGLHHLDHPRDTTHLTLDPSEAIQQLLPEAVYPRRIRTSNLNIPPLGIYPHTRE